MRVVAEERANGRRRVVHVCEGDGRTEQAHKNQVDINQIVSRYAKTGQLPVQAGCPCYGDFSGIHDYHSCLEAVRLAEEGFMSLPADMRKRFANDPGQLLEFLSSEANREEATRLGLLEPVAPDLPPEVVVEPEAPLEPSEPE